MITFSRAATQELRDRVRALFVEAAEALPTPATPGPHPTLLAALRDASRVAPADDAERAQRRRRLLDAVANYDAATIATTHEFCHAVLRSLGVAGDSDSAERLRDDISALAGEVIDDHYLAAYADVPDGRRSSSRTHRRAAAAALENPHAELRPHGEPVESVRRGPGRLRRGRARRGRGAQATHRACSPSTTCSPGWPEAVRAGGLVRRASGCAPAGTSSWSTSSRTPTRCSGTVLRGAFAEQARLVLIGDPKQAIYAFRGGDTPTYLRAVDGADRCRPSASNWRSDPAVVDALQVLTRGAPPRRRADHRAPGRSRRERSRWPAAAAAARRRAPAPGAPRRLPRDQERHDRHRRGPRPRRRRPRRRHRRQLASGRAVRRSRTGPRRSVPGDIAVLLHSVKEEAPRIQAELAARGIPSVINAAESVMLSQGGAATGCGCWRRWRSRSCPGGCGRPR